MKFVRKWRWEHLWAGYSILSFFVLPGLAALWTVPHLPEVFARTSPSLVVTTALFGMGWGAGSVLFGLGVDALGMALGFSMITGIYMALGSLIPFVILTPDLIWSRAGFYLVLGNVVAIVGVVLTAIAGHLRDAQAGATLNPGALNPQVSFREGLIISILSGVLSGMLNFSYAFGKPLAETAERLGATASGSLNAIWLIALSSGGLLNLLYCLHLMQRRRTWTILCRHVPGNDLLWTLVMSALFTGSVIIYGWGAADLGRLGPSLGWSLWNAILILTTLACGLITGEWSGVARRPLSLLLAGVGSLVIATFLLGASGVAY